MTPDIVKHIDSHVRKAERLHPQFCQGLLANRCKDLYKASESHERAFCNRNPCVENILNEEVAELYSAIAREDWIHARSELYDCIAVLVRLDRELVRMEEESGNARVCCELCGGSN